MSCRVKLPDEVLMAVMHFVKDAVTLCHCSCVSTQWLRVASDERTWAACIQVCIVNLLWTTHNVLSRGILLYLDSETQLQKAGLQKVCGNHLSFTIISGDGDIMMSGIAQLAYIAHIREVKRINDDRINAKNHFDQWSKTRPKSINHN